MRASVSARPGKPRTTGRILEKTTHATGAGIVKAAISDLAIPAARASLPEEEPNMTINLPEDLERFIRAEVLSGHFASEEAALVEAVRLLRRQLSQVTKPISTPTTTAAASTQDPLLGAMRDAADELDEVVGDAMKQRE
jgi:Arc/MetJ-type ribon-helix-helix transcriptional regulator